MNGGGRRPVGGSGRATRGSVVMGSGCVRPSVFIVVNRIVRLGLVVSLSLLRNRTCAGCTVGGDAIDAAVRDDPYTVAGRLALLRFGGIVNDDHLFGQTILIKLVPVRSLGSSSFATGGGLGGLGVCGRHCCDRVVGVGTRSVVVDPRSSRRG